MTARTIGRDPIFDFEEAIRQFLIESGVPRDRIVLSVPPDPGFGEASCNAAFLLAREWRRSPRDIAKEIADRFVPQEGALLRHVEPAGAGFLNFHLNYDEFVPHVLMTTEAVGSSYGRPEGVESTSVVIEHTSVNPNKEWHIGHLRNAVIGDVLVRLMRLAGHRVQVQNYIDDTGRQAAEAVFALEEYRPSAPSDDQKFDQYVGTYYVRLNAELGEACSQERPEALRSGIERTLHEMEDGRHRPLIERVVAAQLETAARAGATYDLLVWESDILSASLLDDALQLLKQSPRVFVPESGEYKGAVVIELGAQPKSGTTDNGQEPTYRVLVRSNGLPTYTGKDIPYMMWKFGLLEAPLQFCAFPSAVGTIRTTCPVGQSVDMPIPEDVYNVVAEHQALPQQTVIEGLAAAGYEKEASHAHHVSYGMVSQAQGRISGRQGSGISSDQVLDEAAAVARERIEDKQPDLNEIERTAIAEAIAVGSVRYLMTQYSAVKPIVFDLRDVVSFEGNTGLYLQYALVRMNAIMRKAEAEHGITDIQFGAADPGLLQHDAERSLLLRLARFPRAIDDAIRLLAVNQIAEYAHTLAAEFSQFYRDCPILPAEAELRLARLRLVHAARLVLGNAVTVLGIPVVERM